MSSGGGAAGTVGVMGLVFWFAMGTAMFIALGVLAAIAFIILMLVVVAKFIDANLLDATLTQAALMVVAPASAVSLTLFASRYDYFKLALYNTVIFVYDHPWTIVFYYVGALASIATIVYMTVLLATGENSGIDFIIAGTSFIASLVLSCAGAYATVSAPGEAKDLKYKLICIDKVDAYAVQCADMNQVE